MNPLICRVELLMLPSERQDTFLPLMSDIHLWLTSHTTSERMLTTSQGRREPEITVAELIEIRATNHPFPEY